MPTKTLEVQLVNPTANKSHKLTETRREYNRALQDAFSQHCETPSATNDVVVQYDLSGYAKNALKKYVPQLTGDSYDADELADDHPVKFTNEGFDIDHKPQNAFEWYLKVPHHEDYDLWLPAGINPDQRPLIEALSAGDAEPGEFRLLERDGAWYLHITVEFEVADADCSESDEITPVGVDIGEAALATVCHRDESGSPTAPTIWNDEAKTVRALRETYFTATRRLQKRGSEVLAETYGDEIWEQIDDIIHTVSREVVNHVASVDGGVIVLENLTYIRESMDYGAYMNRRLHGWAFATLHSQITYKAAEKGIEVVTVDPRNTSKECHACKKVGSRRHQATFSCTTDNCWVSEFHADVNGAVNIADRYPAGENHPQSDQHSGQKVAGNDSGGDGASLTGPQDSHADAEPQQVTLGTYAS
jgi:transposase, IS605 OrfB family, central region